MGEDEFSEQSDGLFPHAAALVLEGTNDEISEGCALLWKFGWESVG